MKKLLHSLTGALLAAAAIAPQASAYTIDQLASSNGFYSDAAVGFEVVYTQKNATTTSLSTPFMSFAYTSNGQITLQAQTLDNTKYLVIDGLFGGLLYAPFTVSGSTIRMSDLGTGLGYFADASNQTKPVTGEPTENGASFPYYDLYGAYNVRYSTYKLQSSWIGSITENERYYVITLNPVGIVLYTTKSNWLNGYAAGTQYYDKVEIYVPKDGTLNSIFTDNYLNTDREYPARTVVDFETNRLQIWNMTCNGFAVSHELRNASNYQYYFSYLNPVEGTIHPTDATSGTITLDAKQGVTSLPTFTYVSDQIYKTALNEYYLCKAGSTNTSSVINGTYKIQEYGHDGAERWHKNSGGNLKTAAVMTIDFDDMQKRNNDKNHNVGPYKNTQLSAEVELTANPTYFDHILAHTDDRISLAAAIAEENCDYVDYYELIVLPYTTTSINGDSKFSHSDHGHSQAINLTKDGSPALYYLSELKTPRAITPTKTLMGSEMTYDELRAAGWNESDIANAKAGKMSLYIKANYNNGMEPTYHNLMAATKLTTGMKLNEAMDMLSVSISAVAGGIVVEGYEGNVEVYTAAGVQVYAGVADGTISVAPGLYIVKAGSRVEKLNVR